MKKRLSFLLVIILALVIASQAFAFSLKFGWIIDKDFSYLWSMIESRIFGYGAHNNTATLNGVEVSSFMYQIQGLDNRSDIDLLDATDYDMLVLEPGFNFNDGNYDTSYMVDKLKMKPNGNKRVLLAYIDIGQAEDYRSYWKQNWVAPTSTKTGNPNFLITIDPDGWSGNYPVAYWDDEWKNIWLANGGLIEQIANYGFDGVYLDWVEAYDDEFVRGEANKQGVNAEREMMNFIKKIRQTGKAINPDFSVVAQNAPYLIDVDPDYYASIIDGVSMEDTWFYGKADANWNSPKAGDLSDGERHDDDYSTQNRITQDKKYLSHGIPVFTVDYCISLDNAEFVYKESRANGFIPLVTRVSLSRITQTPEVSEASTSASTKGSVSGNIRSDGAVKITNSLPKSSQNPVFSPDNNSIIYTRFLNGYNLGPSEIVKVKIDGTNEKVIVRASDSDNVNVPYGSWIGNKLCFASDRAGGADEIWTVNDDGSGITQVTSHDEDTEIYYIEPVFNPKNPNWIAFEYVVGENDSTATHQIAVVNVGTGKVTLLTDGTFDDRLPSWSNDGTKILFQRNEYGRDEGWAIYIGDIDSSNPIAGIGTLRTISDGKSDDTDCSWSFDDKAILTSSNRGDLATPNILSFPLDIGSNPKRISFNDTYEDGAPSESHDGKSVAFESHYGEDEDQSSEIWIIKNP